MTMKRRNFIEAGIGGVAALSVVPGVSRAQNVPAHAPNAPANAPSASEIIVVGVDGCDLTVDYLHDYLNTGATVFQYSGNTIDFDRLHKIQSFVDAHSSKVMLAKSCIDILTAKQANKVAVVVGVQDCYPLGIAWHADRKNPPNNWFDYPPITALPEYYERGLRIANLAYNFANFFGGGCLDPTTPLSRAGRYIVGQMHEIGILVDCSHSGEQTTLDIINMAIRASRPVVHSHSNPVAIADNPRNISDRVIDGIAKTGGLIGLNPLNAFLLWSRKDAPHADTGPFPPLASLSQYVDAMDYIRHRVGIDHIGIGSDFTVGNPPDVEIGPVPSESFIYPPEMSYNQPSGLQYVKGFDTVLGIPKLRAELVRHGYSSGDIAKVLGGNWVRVFRQAWNS